MKTIPLTNSTNIVLIDDCDYARVSQYRWFFKKTRNDEGYPARSVRRGKKIATVWLHRFIMDCPDGLTVDHLDGNRLNAMKSNLECITYEENNKRKHERIKSENY